MMLTTVALGQSRFPDRPVRIVTLSAPSDGSSLMARFIAPLLAEQLRQSVYVDDRGGGGGIIGTRELINAKPPGYSMLFGTSAVLTNTFAYKNPGYRAIDLALVAPVSIAEYALLVNKAVTAKNLSDLIANAKANPGKLTYGVYSVAGANSLVMERFLNAADIDLLKVMHKSSGQVGQGMLRGDINLYLISVTSAANLSRNPGIRVIAVTGDQRWKSMPDVPTFQEQGYSMMSGTGFWDAMFMQSAAPRLAIDTLREAMRHVNGSDQMKANIEKQGKVTWTGSLDEFNQYLSKFTKDLEADFRMLKISPPDAD
jgi:tripartite-type tricarboxylate transporter receptor subunit TctC